LLGSGGPEPIVGLGGASVSTVKLFGALKPVPLESSCSARAVKRPSGSDSIPSTEKLPSAGLTSALSVSSSVPSTVGPLYTFTVTTAESPMPVLALPL
jgi:hypothetical protein